MPVPQANPKTEALTTLNRVLAILEITKLKAEELESSHGLLCHLNCLEKIDSSRSLHLYICLVKQMIQVIQMIEATEFEPAQDFLEAVKDVKNCSYQAYFDIQNCIEKHEENDSQPIV